MKCPGKIEVICYEGIVSHGQCNCCGRTEILPCENYNSFIKQYGSSWACDQDKNVITDEDKINAVDSYKLFRKTAIELLDQGKPLGRWKPFAFSREINDIQLMEYKSNYKLHLKGYTMRWIIEFTPSGKRILVYEKDT